MLYAKGIAINAKKAGIPSLASEKSNLFTDCIIINPTMIRAGAVAKPGTAKKIGENNNAIAKKAAVTKDVNPVLPPSATPSALYT